jgi:hypothetical protein
MIVTLHLWREPQCLEVALGNFGWGRSGGGGGGGVILGIETILGYFWGLNG